MGRAMGVVCCFEEEASNYVSADSSPAHEAKISETDPPPCRPLGKAPEPTGSTVEEGTEAEQSVEGTGNPALNAAIRLFGGKVREVENRSGEGLSNEEHAENDETSAEDAGRDETVQEELGNKTVEC